MRHLILCWIMTIMTAQASSSDDIHVSGYDIDVRFIPGEKYLQARADIHLTTSRTDDISFYLHGELRVDSILYDNTEIAFKDLQEYSRADYSLVVRRTTFNLTANDSGPHQITVYYSGYFNPSQARSPSDYMRIDPQDGVLLRSFYYSIWFPVFSEYGDDTYPVDFNTVRITTPPDFHAIFTGTRRAEYTDEMKRTSEWQALQTDFFDAQCTARKYNVLKNNHISVYYLENDSSQTAAHDMINLAGELDAFFTKNYRPQSDLRPVYILQMPMYGDISSGTVVGISSHAWHHLKEAEAPKRLLAHEMVHPFVRIPVTMDQPIYALVVEGFPSYFHLPALAHLLGEKWYADYIAHIEEQYIRKRTTGLDRRGRPLPEEMPILSLTAEDIGTYKERFILNDRVILFFNYLRRQMDESVFQDFVKILFTFTKIDDQLFRDLILKYNPDMQEDLNTWLESTDFPTRFHLEKQGD